MTALATDNFNRANGGLGTNWTTVSGENALAIVSNVVSASEPANDGGGFYNAVVWPNDQYSQANITASATGYSAADGPGVSVRVASGATTYYRLVVCHAGSSNWAIEKKVAGSFTLVASRTQAWTDGDLVYVEVQGTSLQPKRNGTSIGAAATDSAISSGNAGLAYSGEGTGSSIGTWDNWEGGDFSAGATDPFPVAYRPWIRRPSTRSVLAR